MKMVSRRLIEPRLKKFEKKELEAAIGDGGGEIAPSFALGEDFSGRGTGAAAAGAVAVEVADLFP
jgi:hypothetical protein